MRSRAWPASILLAAVVACSGASAKQAGEVCVASSECGAGLVCDFGVTPHVCAGQTTVDAREVDADPSAIDAAEIDAPETPIDAAVIDARIIDGGPPIDAAVIDAPAIDAAVIDAAVIDAPAIDAPTDAPVDAPPDA